MFLLGSKAATAPASLEEDNPTFTSAAATEQPISVGQPTLLEQDAQTDCKILTPVLLHLQFGASLHSADNQLVEERCHRVFAVLGLGVKN